MLTASPTEDFHLRDRVRTTDTHRVGIVVQLYPFASVVRLQFDNGDEHLWSSRLLERVPSGRSRLGT